MTVHLFTRSSYTMLESTIRIPELVKKAKELGYTSVSLTDHNVMYGAASFFHACENEQLHPLIGMETDVSFHDAIVPFLLLAEDNHGYQDLMKLSSLINDGRQPQACTVEELKQYDTHCVLIVYGEGGWFDSELVNEENQKVAEKISVMKQELGEFDVALSYQEASLWKMRNAVLKRICQRQNIHTVALNKIYYLEKNDSSAYRVLRGIRTGETLQDASLTDVRGRYFLSQEEMAQLYDRDDLQRTDEIARMCQADGRLKKTSLPAYHARNNIPSRKFLEELCIAGLKKRLNNHVTQKYADRLKYELNIIVRMHFEDYFLIVYDFIRYARKQGIMVGPGRGSACGSLVAYCLGITMIDPLKYNLLFERFLNPERVSMPDIDTDIPDNKREQVINYVYETYGADHIANIITFNTLGPKAAIRDIGKVMAITSRDTEMISRLIPADPGMTLKKAYEATPRLRQVVSSEERFQRLFRMAVRLEGLPRHASIHAAGIVMSSLPLNEVIPTAQLNEGMRTSQFEAAYLEERGLIKMDFLGLRNLTTIDEIVRKIRQENPDFDIMKIPLNDPKTFDVFDRADTMGVFQFESEGMKNLLRRIHPQKFEEIAAVLALYRPASMDSIPQYIENRKNPSRIQYPSRELEPVLRDTYGVMIYQEQAMLTAEVAAGFSLGKADILRKAMSKKKADQLNALKDDFMKGAIGHGYTQQMASHLFDLISKFAGYGFNKSHAVAYSLISYQMAYLKAEYPLYFYTSLLDSVIGDVNKTSQYVFECRRRGIRVTYPSVNDSERKYTQKNGSIVLPLAAVKGVGVHAGSDMIAEREKNGPYADFFDFTARVLLHGITRKQIEALIDAGALDCLGETRRTYKYALDDAMRYSDLIQIRDGNQISINLGLVSKPVLTKMADDSYDRMENERAALGFNLGPSPITAIRKQYGFQEPYLSQLMNMRGKVSGFAMIRSVRQHRTKKGDMMAFLVLSDETAEMDCAVMPRQYNRYASGLVRGTYIRFNAKIQDDGRMMADAIQFVRKR